MKSTSILLLFLLARWLPAQNPPSAAPAFETRTSVGQPMPAFTVADTAGRAIDIQALRGSVVVLNFWATWCGPCRAELPRLEHEVWQKYKADGLVVIGISRGEKEPLITKFAGEIGLTFRLAADPERQIYDRFASSGIPRTYVVDRNGKIVFQTVGYEKSHFDEIKPIIERELSRLQKR